MTFKGREGPVCEVVLAWCPISQSAFISDPAFQPSVVKRPPSIIHKSHLDVAVISAFLGAYLAISTIMHHMTDLLAMAMPFIYAFAVEDS